MNRAQVAARMDQVTAAMYESDVKFAVLNLRTAMDELDMALEKHGVTKPERAAAINGAVGRILVGE